MKRITVNNKLIEKIYNIVSKELDLSEIKAIKL